MGEERTKTLGKVVHIDEQRVQGHQEDLVRGTVEETLSGLLDAEGVALCGAQRYERSPESSGYRMSSRKVGDIRLYYETCGQGAPLLLLHGLGSSARDWEHQASVFAERYRVVIPELRGHGRSDKPPGPYSMPLLANDIASLIESLDIAPAHVVGLSLGGFVAFQLVLDHRDSRTSSGACCS